MTMIPLDQIHEPEAPVRRRDTSPEQDETLRASIAALGQLQPILVRPNGNGYQLVAGRRRLRIIRALGHGAIEAQVLNIRPDHATAAAAAENMARVGMDPLDQWRAIVQLQADGFGLAHAAACLGLSERAGRRLDKLGRLHPDIIALIERFGMPDEDEIGIIAQAPTGVQAAAAASHARHVSAVDDEDGVDWLHIANACDADRISRRHAIFDIDVEPVRFEEDLFAQPGDEDAVTTTDVAGFLAAQQRALTAQIAAAKAKKQRVELAATDKNGRLKLPPGWADSFGNPDKPKKTETVFLAIAKDGYYIGQVVRAVAIKAGKAGDTAPDTAADDDGAEPQTARGRPAPGRDAAAAEPDSRDPITAAGRDAIARAKTEALVARFTDGPLPFNPTQLLTFLVLALGARTVRVSNGTSWGQENFRDLAARLVRPDGCDFALDHAAAAAAEALSRLLIVPLSKESPDPAVEWIGHFARAGDLLPRFDTPDFLQHVNGAELKRLAVEAQLKPAKTVAGLREQLAGALPDWRPAVFGAPGPKGGDADAG